MIRTLVLSSCICVRVCSKSKFQDKRVLVIGSTNPWVEVLVLSRGATDIVTVDYQRLTVDHPKVRWM